MKKIIQKKHFLCAFILMASSMLQAQNSSNPVGAIPGVIDVSPMGAATYTIPIEVVPGTQGMQPNLAVVYNSFGGMGILGMKWSLSGLSAITRCGQIPYYDGNITAIQFNDDDRFAIDGDRLLGLNSGNYMYAGEYATEMENFTRVIPYWGTSRNIDHFKAYTDNGTVIEYGNTTGNTSNSKLEVATNQILSWLINRITDANGNYMTFNYVRYGNEILINEIRYTGNSFQPYAKVKFDYTDLPDTLGKNTYFVGGYGIPQTKLLETITVSYMDTVVRKYKFEYNDGITGERTAHLKKIVLYGEGNNLPQLNATTIEWGENYSTLEQKPISGNFPNGKILTGDFNGDGYADMVVYDMNWSGGKMWESYIYNPSNKTYEKKATGIYTSEDNNNLFFAQDINKDGKDELIIGVRKYDYDIRDYYHELSFFSLEDGVITAAPKKRVENLVGVYFGDFDGDGNVEILYVTGVAKNKVVTYTLSVDNTRPIQIFTNYNSTSPPKLYIDVFDYNGNGIKDIKATLDGTTKIYELQKGTFKAILNNASLLPPYYNSMYAFYGDVNGDGIADILVCEYWKNEWILFIAKGDGTYIENNLGNELANVYNFQTNEFNSKIRFADINGDGKEDIIQVVKVGSTTSFNILLSEGCVNGEYKYTKKTVTDIDGFFLPLENWQIGDYNGDGKLDIIYKNNNKPSEKPKVIYFNQDKDYEFVKEIVDGIGKKIKLNYEHKYLIAQSRHRFDEPHQRHSRLIKDRIRKA